MEEPYLGAAVHYVAHGSKDGTYPRVCRTARITEVGAWVTPPGPIPDREPRAGEQRTLTQTWEPRAVALTVLNPTGLFFPPVCEYHDGEMFSGSGGVQYPPGTWHWPHL